MAGLPGPVQQLDGSHKSVATGSDAGCRGLLLHGKRLQFVSYASQVVVIFTVVVACLVNLSLGDDKSALWSSLLSLALGCMLPNPKLRRHVKQHQLLPSPTFQLQSPVLSGQHHDALHNSLAENGGTDGRIVGMRLSRDDVHENVVYDT